MTRNRNIGPALGLVLTCLLLGTCQDALAASVFWDFNSPGTGVTGSIEIDDTHADYIPGGEVSLGAGILDLSFTDGTCVWTPPDTSSFTLTFGTTTGPNHLGSVLFSATDDQTPPSTPTEYGLLISGATNGSLFVSKMAPIGGAIVKPISDGTFWVQGQDPTVPEPMTMLAVGLGISGLGGYIRKRRRC